ncbi:MAG TPA: amidohydrolase family protein, partial [Ktedonobacterales bacterium]|nr:amidohydrolase family protein [Ktedonobacterales bacterium]
MPLGHRPILLLLDGDIHTMDVIQPRAQALAIDRGSGRILAVGDNADIRALAGPLTETLDLRGRVVIPGLIDAHTHLAMYAQARLNIDLSQTRSEDEAVALARQRASQTPPGAWVIGQRWDRNHWSPANFPTKASLDAAIPDHPVALSSHDYHSIWVNSLAL